MFLFIFQSDLEGFLYYQTKVHVSIRAKVYICKFCNLDVLMFCKDQSQSGFLLQFFMFTTFLFPICAEAQQLNRFISLQYLIYDREIMINVLSKWAFCDFVSLSSIHIYFPFQYENERHSKCVPNCLVICEYFE